MTIMFHDVLDGDQSITSTVWTQVSSKSGQLNGVDNFVFLSLEYGGTTVATPWVNTVDVGIRVLIDGVERGFDYFKPTLANQYKKFSDFGVLALTESGEHTIIVQARALAAGQTVLIRRIRLMVMQV